VGWQDDTAGTPRPLISHYAGGLCFPPDPLLRRTTLADQAYAALDDATGGRVFVASQVPTPGESSNPGPGVPGLGIFDANSGALLRTTPLNRTDTVLTTPQGSNQFSTYTRVADRLALDRRTNHLFVLDGDASLGMHDATSGALLRTIAVGVFPSTVAVDERAGRAFVVRAASTSSATPTSIVSTINTRTGAVLATTLLRTLPVHTQAAFGIPAVLADPVHRQVIVDGTTILDGTSGAVGRLPIALAGVMDVDWAARRAVLAAPLVYNHYGEPIGFGAAQVVDLASAQAVAQATVDAHVEAGAEAARTNLPRVLTSLIGREREQEVVCRLLGEAALVTLVGPGGVGKTRLALQVAARLRTDYPDGAWLVSLTPLADPALVPGAVTQVLGLREESERPLPATLAGYLQDKRLLLVLDNCEHLVAACAALASMLLQVCPRLCLLATSREALGVSGERRYRVPPLTAPDPRHPLPVDLVGRYEAVRLFVARAQERQPAFALSARNARAVAAVCTRLDGIPLAIAERLAARFRLLTGGPRDAPARQRTLRATMDWSWDLLVAPQQFLLRRLAVFGAGGWTLATAEAVCAEEGIEAQAVLDLLDGLVNKSLVQLSEREPAARYGVLETVLQYAAERLAVDGAAWRDRHLAWCVSLAEEAALALAGSAQGAWLARLEAEHDNLRAALRWAGERGAGDLGLRLAGALWRFWKLRGYLSEGRGWLEAVLAGDPAPTAARGAALHGAGALALDQGAHARARKLLEESLALGRALDDRQRVAAALNSLGNLAFRLGEYRRAGDAYEQNLALQRELADRWGIAASLNNLGLVAQRQGEYGRAAALYEESLALKRAVGDTRAAALTLNNLGQLARAG
jgi:non-specific serine/threonine protein kinase